MELMITLKGSKYTVQDKKQGRTVYTIKKKGFGAGRYLLLDPSNYQLYSLVQVTEERKPTFIISHNDSSIMTISCKSLFLDPTIIVEGRDINGNVMKYALVSKDHKNFELQKDGLACGSVRTELTVAKELQYDVVIEDKIFDDYIPLFAIAVDLAFGEINRNI
ncbi:MAG: hypothetical protein J6K77_03450 [Ruminococcus sp.]|nr:hypothetical protein [Ruminococcus sp.]